MFTTTFGPMFALGIVALLALTLPGAPLVSGSSLGPAPSSTTVSAKIIAGPMSEAQTISSKFWGLDIDVSHSFTLADGANIAATPIVYLRYPGGDPAEQFNDSSNQIFAFDGSVSSAATSISQFISVCQAIHCHSILQLPTEINSSSTAAYLVNYIEHHLGYHPDYWEIGNAPGSWTHYGIPWSKWGKTGVSTIVPSQFPQLVHRYITAIRAVDPTTPIMALGIAVISTYSNPWVSDLTSVDGASLAAVSFHSYAGRNGTPSPTLQGFFSSLSSIYGLPTVLSREQAAILQGCPSCTNVKVIVDEVNAAYARGTYKQYVASFDDTLFLGAEITQGLNNHAYSLEWFDYVGGYPGGWESSPGHLQSQYYLFKDLATQLRSETLPATVTGPSSLYAAITTNASKVAILVVNTNLSKSVSLDLTAAGFAPKATLTELYWPSGQALPSQKSVSETSSPVLAPLSMAVFTGPASAGAILPAASSSGPAPAGGAPPLVPQGSWTPSLTLGVAILGKSD